MSLTAIAFCILFAILCLLSLRRSAWGFALYSLTVYASPTEWWWGATVQELTGPFRWNLCAAIIYAIAVLINRSHPKPELYRTARWCLFFLTLYAVNASIVHFLFASDPEHSLVGLAAIWKKLALFFLMIVSIRDKFDLKLVGWSIILGTTFLAYMVIFEGEGGYEDNRLENLPISLASTSNFFGPLFGFSLVVAGGMLVYGRLVERLLAFCCLPLMCEILIRGNSRGTFLALCVAALAIVLAMKGKARIHAAVMCLLGVVAFIVIMDEQQQEKVFGRFGTTFAAEDQRDDSAAGRLDLWRQGAKMIGDYPLGSGFQAAFKSPRGESYMWEIGVDRIRGVHNAYLGNIASWGIQGFLLIVTAYFLVIRSLRKTIDIARRREQFNNTFFGVCLAGGATVLLVAACFGGSLDKEWFIWWMAMTFALANVVDMENAEEDEVEDEVEDDDP